MIERENSSLSREREIIDNIRILAAATLACASLAAQAQSTEDTSHDTHWKFGVQAGTVHDNARTEPSLQLSFGYEINRIWAVEALANVNALFVRDGAGNGDNLTYEFDSAFGGRVLATLPLSDKWNFVGGLGVVKVHEDLGLGITGPSRDRTGALVSASLMSRMNRHFGLGVEASTFAQSHTLNLGVRGEVHF